MTGSGDDPGEPPLGSGSDAHGAGATLDAGWIDTDVREEFPQLRLVSVVQPTLAGRSPKELRDRLKLLSNRFTGAHAITMRRRPIPQAYRVFFRHIGLDPDATRTPIEAAALDRLWRGGFRAKGRLEAAVLIGLIETGVPVWALDDDRVDGPLGIRPAQAGERLGTGELASDLPEGRLVVADAARPVAVLFGDLAPSHAADRSTVRARIFSVQVAGVPSIHVEEALWTTVEALAL